MNKYFILLTIALVFITKTIFSQHIYYKIVNDSILHNFKDTSNKMSVTDIDSLFMLKNKFSYVLSFFPKMEFQAIKIKSKKIKSVSKVKPTFASIFKAPKDRTYKIYYNKPTQTTLDSVLINNLSLNSQIGLISVQLARIEDFRTGGFFDFVAWYFKQLSNKAKNSINHDDELKAIEVGLGYQLLSLNKENEEKLKIEKWKNIKGYANYVKYNKNRSINSDIISDFINDQPIYNAKRYK